MDFSCCFMINQEKFIMFLLQALFSERNLLYNLRFWKKNGLIQVIWQRVKKTKVCVRCSKSFEKHYKRDVHILARERKTFLTHCYYNFSIFNISSWPEPIVSLSSDWINPEMLCLSNVRSKCCVKPSEKSCGFIFNPSWHAMISWSKNLFAKTWNILLCDPAEIQHRAVHPVWKLISLIRWTQNSFSQMFLFRFSTTAPPPVWGSSPVYLCWRLHGCANCLLDLSIFIYLWLFFLFFIELMQGGSVVSHTACTSSLSMVEPVGL